MSSHSMVYVKVDGQTVYMRDGKERSYRGIHVVILNQLDANVMSSRIFDVYTRTQDVALLNYVNSIKPNRLFIFSIMVRGL